MVRITFSNMPSVSNPAVRLAIPIRIIIIYLLAKLDTGRA